MPRVNEKTELKIEVDFNECSEDARLDLLNRLAKLYDQPGAKLSFTLEYGHPSDMFDAADEIDEVLAHRSADVKVKYSWKGKDMGTIEQRGATITPMERAGVAIERRPALVREG